MSKTRHPYFDLPLPIPAAHRGASGEAPENTLVAFECALEQGARIVETDVHATRDGVPVLIHDDRVERTTDGEGRIADLDHAELRRLDAGYRFSPDGGRSFPFRNRGLRVPTLEEALATFPHARLNLELKEARPELVERTLDVIRASGRPELALITAAEDEAMAILRRTIEEQCVPVATGASIGEVRDFLLSSRSELTPPPGPMALQIPAEYHGLTVVTPELVSHAHAHDVQVHVWTVNDADETTRLLDLGVDAIISDFPARLCEWIGRWLGRREGGAPGDDDAARRRRR